MAAPSDPWTIRRLLEWTSAFFARREVDSPRLSAELLLSHVLDIPRIKLYTDHDKTLTDAHLARYRSLVKRAGEHEPIQYLTGRGHFFNLEFAVTPETLIPRPETETLVEHVLQMQRHQPGLESPRILDLCTGTGCIAAAIAHHLKSAVVVAVDLSAGAIKVAEQNIAALGLAGRVTVLQGDLFGPLRSLVDSRPFDIIVANPPYIPTAQIPGLDKNVRDFEPHSALDGGLDGLAIHRRILADAPAHLAGGGRLYLEIAFDQGAPAMEIARTHEDFQDPKILKDHAGNARVLMVRKGSAS